jgi:hypothetical protein
VEILSRELIAAYFKFFKFALFYGYGFSKGIKTKITRTIDKNHIEIRGGINETRKNHS